MPTKGIYHSNHHIGDQRVIYLYPVTSFSWADETYAYSPNIGNKDKPNTDTTKIESVELMSFIEIIYWNMDKELLTGVEMT